MCVCIHVGFQRSLIPETQDPRDPLSKWAMLTGSVGEDCLQPGYSQKHQWSFDCDVTAWLIMKVQSPLTHSQA